MGRRAEPRWYESRKAWYVEIGGKQILLAKGKGGKAEAFAAFHRLMAEGASPARRAELSVQLLCDLFLGWSESRVAPATHEGYVRRLQSFVEMYGASRAAGRPAVPRRRWLELPPGWNDSTKFGYVTALKRAYNWARKQGHLDANPIADAERPAMGRRAKVLTADQARAVIAHVKNGHFRDLLIALWETGCRPAELVTLTADRVDLAARTWRVANKTRRKTGEPYRHDPAQRPAGGDQRPPGRRPPRGADLPQRPGQPLDPATPWPARSPIRADLGYGPRSPPTPSATATPPTACSGAIRSPPWRR
jgi:integrase